MADLTAVMIEGGADFLGGGAQRFAWDRGETIGLITTGGFIAAGLFLPMFVKNQMTDTLAHGMLHSGAAIAGWIATERVFNMTPNPVPALNPGGARPALRAPQHWSSQNGVRVPEVAIMGTNHNTGEPIQFSGI